MTVQANLETLEKIPETIKVGNARLIIFVERWKLRCFRCGSCGHIRAECEPPPKETEKESEAASTTEVEEKQQTGENKEIKEKKKDKEGKPEK